MSSPGRTGIILGAIAGVVIIAILIVYKANRQSVALTEGWIVTQVLDGETITVRQTDGQQMNVCLCGIVAALDNQAKEKLISLVAAAENQVMIIPVEKDSDEYTVAEVMAYGTGEADISFQEELLKSGLAKTRKSRVGCPNQLSFEEAQKIGIATKAGVWK
ncbi:thermonuclease family protein [Anabaena sp. UHCC 0399]|uniref:thermonuclease family protein n=1 Tax=Anabaena sp. UHCC 0399 TaxID=3110238 RepID=UPI002B206D61|nr:thermonuclease family protein [Anabaena sp. UHCC 0399]MEA5567604.1 thermonuclease family protein [Anabaena sp. UHCC 0399]